LAAAILRNDSEELLYAVQATKRLNDEGVGKILQLTRRFSILPQNVQTTQIAVDMKYESIVFCSTRPNHSGRLQFYRPQMTAEGIQPWHHVVMDSTVR